MADYIRKEIGTYSVTRFMNNTHNVDPDQVGMIYLYPEAGSVFAFIKIFSANKTPLPEVELGPGYSWFAPSVYDGEYPFLIDLLRNEKPLFFTYNKVQKWANISSSAEPVGEGE